MKTHQNSPRRTPTLAALAAAGMLCMSIAGCEDTVNAESYAAIQPGMSLHEVEKIMGGKGTQEEVTGVSISAAGMAGSSRSTQAVYVWKSKGNIISVTVNDGKVLSVSKSGF
ncbi:MAG: hypothetical protein KF864_04195 [Phycisphaeraceae bacterium]|nr:hypothetical protein [Phycisphaeraceae bacterium]